MINVVSAVIVRDGRILLTQRRADKDYPFRWECPGGKVEGGESHYRALEREICEEIGIAGLVVEDRFIWSGEVPHNSLGSILLYLYPALTCAGDMTPVPQEGQGIGWFTVGEMADLVLTPGNAAALGAIAGFMERCDGR